jgi:hypothetical protein
MTGDTGGVEIDLLMDKKGIIRATASWSTKLSPVGKWETAWHKEFSHTCAIRQQCAQNL